MDNNNTVMAACLHAKIVFNKDFKIATVALIVTGLFDNGQFAQIGHPKVNLG